MLSKPKLSLNMSLKCDKPHCYQDLLCTVWSLEKPVFGNTWAKEFSTGLGRPKTLSWKQKQKHSLNSLTPTWPKHGFISWNIGSAEYKQVLHRRGFYGQICLGNTGLKVLQVPGLQSFSGL